VSRGRSSEGVGWRLDCESNNFAAPAVLYFATNTLVFC
jgi:hypothetical protein